MENQETLQAIFSLMQDDMDIMSNIDIIKQNAIDYSNIEMGNLNKLDERFYNFLLIFLRNTPDTLWLSNQHRLKIYEIIKEQLDDFSINPNPYIKDKYYT